MVDAISSAGSFAYSKPAGQTETQEKQNAEADKSKEIQPSILDLGADLLISNPARRISSALFAPKFDSNESFLTIAENSKESTSQSTTQQQAAEKYEAASRANPFDVGINGQTSAQKRLLELLNDQGGQGQSNTVLQEAVETQAVEETPAKQNSSDVAETSTQSASSGSSGSGGTGTDPIPAPEPTPEPTPAPTPAPTGGGKGNGNGNGGGNGNVPPGQSKK